MIAARIGMRRQKDLVDLTTATEVIRDRRASPHDLLRAATVEQITAVIVEEIAIIVIVEATAISTIAVVVTAFLIAAVVEASVVAEVEEVDFKMIGGSEEELEATISSWPKVLTKSR